MERRIFGIENEYGVTCTFDGQRRLTPDEVARYISHRLAVAGREEPLFTDAAVACIAQATRGVPRNINILCDTALVYGYSMEAEMIDESIINDVIRDRATYGVFGNSHAAP